MNPISPPDQQKGGVAKLWVSTSPLYLPLGQGQFALVADSMIVVQLSEQATSSDYQKIRAEADICGCTGSLSRDLGAIVWDGRFQDLVRGGQRQRFRGRNNVAS